MKPKHKLVRDNIPDIMKQEGQTPTTYTAEYFEFDEALQQKAFEEIKELLAADTPGEIAGEIADLLEVLDAIAEYNGIPPEKIARVRQEKAERCGTFKKRIMLQIG